MSRTLKNLPQTMITRRKSALDKRQLRDREGSRKRINEMIQLIKNPCKKRMVKVSPRGRGMTIVSKQDMVVKANDKFLLGRKEKVVKLLPKRYNVFLKPKIALKEIRSSKRKTMVPQRAKSPPPLQLSLPALIQIADHDLDAADLDEILTCPSPVWWEENDDPWCFEEPLFKLRSKAKDTQTKPTDIKNENTPDINDNKTLIDTLKEIPNKKPTEFKNKRSKLESLVNILKDKSETRDGTESEIERRTTENDNSDVLTVLNKGDIEQLENINIPIETQECLIIEKETECFDLTDDGSGEKIEKPQNNLDIINKYEMLLKHKRNRQDRASNVKVSGVVFKKTINSDKLVKNSVKVYDRKINHTVKVHEKIDVEKLKEEEKEAAAEKKKDSSKQKNNIILRKRSGIVKERKLKGPKDR